MSVRYIYNTHGKYVAFVQNNNLFSPKSDWIGYTKDGTNFFDTNGYYLGSLLSDDRLVISDNKLKPPKQYPPYPPFKPFVPFAPFPRLSMSALPYGYRDIFIDGPPSVSNGKILPNLSHLIGASLVAGDGTFLGYVTKDRYDPKSMGNSFGNYGSRYSETSIFNQYSQYGGKYGNYSPFNPYCFNPPVFKNNYQQNIAYLSVNTSINDRIDPELFMQWFSVI